jgi:ATP-dependent Lon protease
MANIEDQDFHLLDAEGKPIIPGMQGKDSTIVPMTGEIPENIFVVPVNEPVLFPGMTLPLIFQDEELREIMDQAAGQRGIVCFVPRLMEEGETAKPEPHRKVLDSAKVARVGVLARILRTLNLPDGNKSYFISCFTRCRILKVIRPLFPPIAKVELANDVMPEKTAHLEAMWRAARQTLGELIKEIPGMPEAFSLAAANIDSPGQLTDFVAAHLEIKREERIALLEDLEVAVRLPKILEIVTKELEMVRLAAKIRDDIRQKLEKSQKEYYLREQLKTIRRELGEEVDQKEMAIREIREAVEQEGLPEHARKRAEEEIRRLEVLSPDSPEYNVVRTYLEWLTGLPWSRGTVDNTDMKKARRILEADHYGLKEVKERVLEFLAVHKLKPDQHGAILCFVGPPGVGKTSLGQSIARAMGRKFYRFSLGGMRDEAEIKGHRRTYIGAMPGKILQGLKYVSVRNPVVMLDEIDKLGADWRGDPSSAMLEVLDPAQNVGFLDHYIDVPYDLSKVMFICTANFEDYIPVPLYDRMEIIELPGYILEEKVEIARRYLVPRQVENNGLKKNQVKIGKPVLGTIVEEYTSEAGVRELERKVGRICRKVASKVAEGSLREAVIAKKDLHRYLGPVEYIKEVMLRTMKPGLAVGLAWTPVGGEIMFIEASRMLGKGGFKVTGQLGEVMEESTQIALSYVRAHNFEFGVDHRTFDKMDIHVHFPAGAVPKDGPSAGITITTALISLLGWRRGRKVRPRLAMTGEMTLRGDVLPVGGIREKVIGAKRAGVREIILPRENKRHADEIPAHVIRGIKLHFVDRYDEVVKIAFQKPRRRKASAGKKKKTTSKGRKGGKRGKRS